MNQRIIIFKSAIYSTPRRIFYGIDGLYETVIRLFWIIIGGIKFTLTWDMSNFLTKAYDKIHKKKIMKKYFKKNTFNCKWILFPGFSNNITYQNGFISMSYHDIILPHIISKGKYDKKIIKKLQYIWDWPYMYKDENINFTIKKGDIVIDAWAWIGCFSAIASSLWWIVYAFEPTKETFKYLQETKKLNKKLSGKIIPINKWISDKKGKIWFEKFDDWVGWWNKINNKVKENIIDIISIDEFVRENKISRVDFIKSDIEWYERQLLKWAKNTIKKGSRTVEVI